MPGLIGALIQVKTPLTLFAFVCLVFLMAFKTKGVAQRLVEIFGKKTDQEHLHKLLNRFMVLTFAAFVLACVIAVTGQILTVRANSQSISLSDLRDELRKVEGPEDRKQAALKDYADGLGSIQAHDTAQAIQALQRSVEAIPTLSAQMTLAYLFHKQGDSTNTRKYAAEALSQAIERGDSLAQVRMRRLLEGSDLRRGCPGGLVGSKSELPKGGQKYEEAAALSPGLYIMPRSLNGGVFEYFKIPLNAGQNLRIDFRTPDGGGGAGAAIYDADGVIQPGNVDQYYGGSLGSVRWAPPNDETVFFSVGTHSYFANSANTVYCVSID